MKKWLPPNFVKIFTLCVLVAVCLALSGCTTNFMTAENLKKFGGIAAKGAAGGIGTLGGMANAADTCWSCTVFIIAWNAMGAAIKASFSVTPDAARLLLGIGLLFWLSFTIGKMILSLKEPNMKDYIPLIAGVLFKCMCVGAVLSSPVFLLDIINTIMEPILRATLEVSTWVLPPMGSEGGIDGLVIFKFIANPMLSLTSLITNPLSQSVGNYPVFTKEIGDKVVSVIYALYETFRGGFNLGVNMLISISFSSICTGLLVMSVFFFFMFYFPLLLIEGFVTLTVVLVLFPFILVGWCFPSTKGYMTEVFKVIFQSVAQLLITCIYIAVIVTVIDAKQSYFSPSRFLTDPSLQTGLQNMGNAGLAFFGLIFVLVKITNDIPNITSYFVGEINKSIIARSFNQMNKFLLNAGKMAVGSALMGTGVMSSVGKVMMGQAAKDAVETGSTPGNGGDSSRTSPSSAEERAQTQAK